MGSRVPGPVHATNAGLFVPRPRGPSTTLGDRLSSLRWHSVPLPATRFLPPPPRLPLQVPPGDGAQDRIPASSPG